MAAAVDYSPASVPPVAGAKGPASEFSCNACSEAFENGNEQRAHCKTERHIYNTKRRLAGLKPISVEAWERKLKESRNVAAGKQENKGTSHLKAGKAPRSKANSDATAAEDGSFVPPSRTTSEQPSTFEEAVFSPRRSLFDRKHFDDREENLNYMSKQFNFYIPDREYCTDVDGLLKALFEKINKPPHACLCCNRKFADAGAVRRHMQDMAHCRIGSLARTRRGGKDERGSEELQAELEDFYDFTASTREVTERITTPKDKAACLHRFFDADRDGFLDHVEVSALYYAAQTFAAQGSSTSSSSTAADSEQSSKAAEEEEETPLVDEAIYRGACAKTGADPEEGLDPEALLALYTEGLADLDAHFSMLQDVLTKKLLNRSKARMEALEEEDDEDDDGEEDEDEDEEDDDDEEGSDSDSTEILECDDEDEFEEVMRILGLQKMEVLETGDIRLPSGKVAIHRNVAHIYKQHLGRFSELAIASNSNKATRGRPVLALSNGAASQINMSQRERTKENRKVIAVIKKQARSELWLGMKANKMQRKCLKIRTGMGDASGGR